LTISITDITFASAFVVLLSIFFLCFYRQIVFTAFDRDFALTQGIAVRALEYALIVCIAITIVLSIRIAGIMLLMSLLTIPQMTINLITSDFKRIIWGSIFIGFLACVAGLFLSYFFQTPSGAFIILILLLLFLCAKIILFLIPKRK
jgi:zinc transport system permease protein